MKQEHIILTKKSTLGRSGNPFLGPSARFFQTDFQPEVEFDLHSEVLGKSEIEKITKDPSVSGIAPSIPTVLVEPFESESTEESSTVAWGIEAVNASNSAFSGKGVKVAVLDTGIDRSHEAFHGVNLIEKNFTDESADDLHGHGTHVAGTIFGRAVDGVRIGVADGVETALIGKVLGQNGGSTKSTYEAITWAAKQGASIISMSLGMDFPGYVQKLVEAGFPVDLATSKALEGYRANLNLYSKLSSLLEVQGSFINSSLLVAAAGNESKREVHVDYEIMVAPPAASNGVLSVGALAKTSNGLTVADFSNTGPRVSGPGVNVQSAKLGGGRIAFSGTSMATPHVAGVCALWAEKLKGEGRLNYRELVARVEGTTTWDSIAPGQSGSDVGSGLVQAP